eukprot:1008082-Amorphochlora_amoeboformis.AAC.1
MDACPAFGFGLVKSESLDPPVRIDDPFPTSDPTKILGFEVSHLRSSYPRWTTTIPSGLPTGEVMVDVMQSLGLAFLVGMLFMIWAGVRRQRSAMTSLFGLRLNLFLRAVFRDIGAEGKIEVIRDTYHNWALMTFGVRKLARHGRAWRSVQYGRRRRMAPEQGYAQQNSRDAKQGRFQEKKHVGLEGRIAVGELAVISEFLPLSTHIYDIRRLH